MIMEGMFWKIQVKIVAGGLEIIQNVTIVSIWSLKDH
jgi:hypothetical protein